MANKAANPPLNGAEPLQVLSDELSARGQAWAVSWLMGEGEDRLLVIHAAATGEGSRWDPSTNRSARTVRPVGQLDQALRTSLPTPLVSVQCGFEGCGMRPPESLRSIFEDEPLTVGALRSNGAPFGLLMVASKAGEEADALHPVQALADRL